MMRAIVKTDGSAYCVARCGFRFGEVYLSVGKGLRLSLVTKWHPVASEDGATWEWGGKTRHLQRNPVRPQDVGRRHLGEEFGADAFVDEQGVTYWSVPLPVTIQCHRCHHVQQVADRPSD